MKIVINALPFKQNSSGIGVMIRELFGRYAQRTNRQCQVILSNDAPEFPEGNTTELIRIPLEHGQGLRRIFFQSFRMGREYCRAAVLLTTDSKTPFFLPKSCKLVPLVTDLAVYRMPEVYQQSRVLLWRLQYRYIRRRAQFFITISEFTKREMTDILGIPPEMIYVIPCACSEQMVKVTDSAALEAVRERYGLPGWYVLFVGNNNPRKNLARMIRAFDLLKERTDLPHRLIIAGEQGWKFNRETVLKDVKHRDDVRFIGFVPDGDMPALYSGAALFAFPTLYEGFGVPVLEAQACGVPVLTSGVSALPGTAGKGALLVDPYNVEDIAQGMERILSDLELSRRLVAHGYENRRRFSWGQSAEELDRWLEKMIR